MATEFFGYQRSNNPIAQVVSSEYATVSIGGNQVSLVQSISADYQQEVRPMFSVGDPGLYWITGHPMGTINISRAVGAGKFFSGFRGGACGRVDSVTLSATQGQNCSQAGGGGLITFTGGMITGVRVEMTAGRVEIIEGVSIKVASMEV